MDNSEDEDDSGESEESEKGYEFIAAQRMQNKQEENLEIATILKDMMNSYLYYYDETELQFDDSEAEDDSGEFEELGKLCESLTIKGRKYRVQNKQEENLEIATILNCISNLYLCYDDETGQQFLEKRLNYLCHQLFLIIFPNNTLPFDNIQNTTYQRIAEVVDLCSSQIAERQFRPNYLDKKIAAILNSRAKSELIIPASEGDDPNLDLPKQNLLKLAKLISLEIATGDYDQKKHMNCMRSFYFIDVIEKFTTHNKNIKWENKFDYDNIVNLTENCEYIKFHFNFFKGKRSTKYLHLKYLPFVDYHYQALTAAVNSEKFSEINKLEDFSLSNSVWPIKLATALITNYDEKKAQNKQVEQITFLNGHYNLAIMAKNLIIHGGLEGVNETTVMTKSEMVMASYILRSCYEVQKEIFSINYKGPNCDYYFDFLKMFCPQFGYTGAGNHKDRCAFIAIGSGVCNNQDMSDALDKLNQSYPTKYPSSKQVKDYYDFFNKSCSLQ